MRYPFAMDCGVYRTSYREDLALHHTRIAKLRLWAIIALLYVLPLVLGSYLTSILNQVAIFAIAAIGLNILTGFTGQISLGHGAFMGVGAFASGYLMTRHEVPFWLAAPAGGFIAAAAGALFGLPSARLKGLYLAIASLAAQVVLDFVFVRWESVTGGINSMSVARPALFGHSIDSEAGFYYLTLSLVLLHGAFAVNLFRTRVGRALVAIRDRDLAAEVMGVDLFRYKVLAFAVSAFYAGVAGALWGPYVLIINPEHFTITMSIELLAMVIIGGLGSVMGSVYGAAFMVVLPIAVSRIATFASQYIPGVGDRLMLLREFVFGVAIILFLMFEPEGLAKLWKNTKDYFRLWPFSY